MGGGGLMGRGGENSSCYELTYGMVLSVGWFVTYLTSIIGYVLQNVVQVCQAPLYCV